VDGSEGREERPAGKLDQAHTSTRHALSGIVLVDQVTSIGGSNKHHIYTYSACDRQACALPLLRMEIMMMVLFPFSPSLTSCLILHSHTHTPTHTSQNTRTSSVFLQEFNGQDPIETPLPSSNLPPPKDHKKR
jgi:hypothetical protein